MDTDFFNDCIQRCPNDVNSLIPIYEEYYAKIVLHISYKFSEQIAEDVAQKFFVDLMRKQVKYEYIKFPTSWIYKCCDRIAIKYYKYELRFTELKEDYVAQDMFAAVKFNDDLKENIMKLDDISQKIIFLYYWEGYSQEEIALLLSLKPATIRQKHHRALKKLKKYL